ncbi:PaaI family thioesterase [Sphingomonas sp. CGMCC 1.13654]|uniref:PaaI family thioesterase n=1 Tax=Sphingomonas chungangi TaxID=2683589 RepID=A0A838L406_9SPHN|nr:PaaI family thioesterase [Sphingomonas chungangi]MBA2933777.1 PaaI family thioesterase [Sphingomonas chungangi]MVW55108.1 hotdog fold thioesterase [Sphingomonas chungangi]
MNEAARAIARDEDEAPAGFRPLALLDGFVSRNGPIYARRESEGAVFGFRVQQRHCNPMGICHGGWLATVADLVLPLSVRLGGLEEQYLLTVHLGIDYLAPVPLGAWVEGRARVLRRTKRMIFADGILDVDGEPVLRASGVFRLGPPAPRIAIG